MPHYSKGSKRGQRVETHNATRRKDVESAIDKPKVCPTCGQKVTGSTVSAGGGAGSA